MIRTSVETKEISAAIHAAQNQGMFAVRQNRNSQTNSRYADLTDVIASIRDVLSKNGLAYMQFVGGIRIEGTLHTAAVTTRILHTSGEWIESTGEFPLAPPPRSKAGSEILNYSQNHGLVLSYARRYALCSALGIATGDDDDAQRLTSKDEARSQPDTGKFQEAAADAPPVMRWEEWLNEWRDCPAPEHAGRTLGDLSSEEMKVVRRNHFLTNPAVVAEMAEFCKAYMKKEALDWATMDLPAVDGPDGYYPGSFNECSPVQVRRIFIDLKTRQSQSAA